MPKEDFEKYDAEEGPKIISVDMFEWTLVKSPDIGETKDLGPCTGVIIYDPETKTALVGHFPDLLNSDLPAMLQKAAEVFSDPKKLKIFLGGLAHEGKYTIEQTKRKRKDFKQALLNQGFDENQITIRWQDSDQGTVMRINPDTGQMDYDTENYDQLNRDDD